MLDSTVGPTRQKGSGNMSTTGELIRAKRLALGMTQFELAGLIGVSEKTVARWEADETSPTETATKLALTLGTSLDELALLVPTGIDPSGNWHVRWQTRREGRHIIDRHELTAAYAGGRLVFSATGNYTWRGDFVVSGESVMGTFQAVDPNRWHRGTMYFWMPYSDKMIGHWVGRSAETAIGTGWGAMARNPKDADDLIAALIEHGWQNIEEWPEV
jgi:transcriptional regulator with XRE-family HTH domain